MTPNEANRIIAERLMRWESICQGRAYNTGLDGSERVMVMGEFDFGEPPWAERMMKMVKERDEKGFLFSKTVHYLCRDVPECERWTWDHVGVLFYATGKDKRDAVAAALKERAHAAVEQ